MAEGKGPLFIEIATIWIGDVFQIRWFLGLLAEAGISIVNLQILEIREEIDGVLQLTFAKEADRQQAEEILAAYELKK